MTYRTEIDGLRAIAIIGVLIYHVSPLVLPGGFLGVDIFLVISGYLITGILQKQFALQQFKLSHFLISRAIRLLPALFVVLICSIITGYFILTPSLYITFSESILSTIFLSSNIFFWREIDYFSSDANEYPLLHLWSLSLEQQFYVLIPFLLFVLVKFRFFHKRIYLVLWLLILLSFCLSVWGGVYKPVANFYLFPTRFWEFLIGVLVALHKGKLTLRYAEHLSVTGLFFIILSYFIATTGDPLPGVKTVIPVLGTGLLLLYGSSFTLVGRFLSIKPLRFIGVMSYSIYLWHNPIFAFARVQSLGDLTALYKFIGIMTTFLLSYISWRFIEEPFRRSGLVSRRVKNHLLLANGLVTLILAICIIFSGGVRNRFSPSENDILDYVNYDFSGTYKSGECFLEPTQLYSDFALDCFSGVNNENFFIIWGDSHAAALTAGFRALGEGVVQLTASGCPPLLGIEITSPPRKHCKNINDFVFEKLWDMRGGTIILHANWSMYDIDLTYELEKTLRNLSALGSFRVIVVGNIPTFRPSLPRLLLHEGLSLSSDLYLTAQSPERKMDNLGLEYITLENDFLFFDPFKVACLYNLQCEAVLPVDGSFVPIVWDYGHLTTEGSVFFVQHVREMLDRN